MSERTGKGEYRGIYAAVLDDPDFQEFSPAARAIFFVLKLKLGLAGIAPFARETLPRYTGHSGADCEAGWEELFREGWIRCERNLVWLRNGLRWDPSEPLKSPNQVIGLGNYLATLPKVRLVNEMARHYGLKVPFPELDEPAPKETLPEPFRDPSEAQREKRERETETDLSSFSPLSARASDADSFAQQAIATANHAMAANPAIGPRVRAIPPDHAGSRKTVAAWEVAGITPDTALPVIEAKGRAYRPDGRNSQITSLSYFDAAVREAHAGGQRSRNGTHGKHRAGKPAPRRRGRIISE